MPRKKSRTDNAVNLQKDEQNTSVSATSDTVLTNAANATADTQDWQSPAVWARQQGFSRQYAHKLIKSGKIDTRNGQVNVIQANEALAQLRATQIKEPLDLSSENGKRLSELLLKTRIKNEMTRGERLQLDVEEKKRQVVPIHEVHERLARLAIVTRDNLLRIPDRIQHELAAMRDVVAIHTTLTAAIRDGLSAVSDEAIEAMKAELRVTPQADDTAEMVKPHE